MSTLGKLNNEMKRNNSGEIKEEKEYKIQVRDGVKNNEVLTSDEQKLLLKDMHSFTSPANAAYYHLCGLLVH